MKLKIESMQSKEGDVHEVHVKLKNVTDQPITLKKPRAGHHPTWEKQFVNDMMFESYPPTIRRSAQTHVMPSAADRTIQPGEAVEWNWKADSPYLKPHELNAMNTSPVFLISGMYQIRAEAPVMSPDNETWLVISNTVPLIAGGSYKLPKWGMGKVVRTDPDEGTLVLSVGSKQGIEVGDQFRAHYSIYKYFYLLTVTDVRGDSADCTVTPDFDPQEAPNVPLVPNAGAKATLVVQQKQSPAAERALRQDRQHSRGTAGLSSQ